MSGKIVAVLAAAAFLAGSVASQAQNATATGGANVRSGTNTTTNTTPPRASTTGTTSRSDTAATQGANKKRFCPPGQEKKKGNGSAFSC